MTACSVGELMGKHERTGLSLADAIKLGRTLYADTGRPQSVRAGGRCVWSISDGTEQHGMDATSTDGAVIGTPFVPNKATAEWLAKAGVR